MKSNKIIIVPETHWDREWYLTFQEYRARLVKMLDKLLNILKTDPNYTNFTFDGQTIPIEDYLEVKPEKREEISGYVQQRRLSIGPMYILPDEFLISGESLIRNLLIGHEISQKLGRVMKVGYIPDPFGHIAQLPQILSGFEIPSVIFKRGFGDEFEKQRLNMEFIWNSPGNTASVLAVHLIEGYDSVAELSYKKTKGKYTLALNKIKRIISKLEKYTATPVLLLNSGSDHHEAHPEIPEIVQQWNKKYPEKLMEQNDFEYYINQILVYKSDLKTFQGELRGGKYSNLLSGVFSARMWIKQRNTKIEYLYEKYTEPLSTITFILDKYDEFPYPDSYIKVGLKWLIKNHPHDSICGCSIDQVHNEMKTRFDWSEQIGNETIKNTILYLIRIIEYDKNDNKIPIFIYNPLPWPRNEIVDFQILANFLRIKASKDFKIIDIHGNDIEFQSRKIEQEPPYKQPGGFYYLCTFLANIPALGYKIYYIIPKEKPHKIIYKNEDFKINKRTLENEYYLVNVKINGIIDVYDKKGEKWYKNICSFEDVGDWGDLYDFSGPNENQVDLKFTSYDQNFLGTTPYIDGPTQKTIKLDLNLNLPASLSEDRFNRVDFLMANPISIYISLYKGIKRVDFKIEMENNSKDHRIRVLFPTRINSEKIDCDGHFYVISRDIKLPHAEKWYQDPQPTNHQKDFVSISENSRTFAILNIGLPEYEAIKQEDGTINLAITLLRCVEWLSRNDLSTRKDNAGPDFNTPEAQNLGKHTFELSLIIEDNKKSWLDSEIHIKGKEFNNPFKVVFPSMLKTPLRFSDKVIFIPTARFINFGLADDKPLIPFLPSELSFLQVHNHNILLSALKKSENDDGLIIRLYNLASEIQQTKITFYEKLKVKSAKVVNFLEETPKNKIKAEVSNINNNNIEITLNPNVIATIKLTVEFK